MAIPTETLFLVGDNPFHRISHLSQQRARSREDSLALPDYSADLVTTSLENGANGFMFSVSDVTLSILRKLSENNQIEYTRLFAIVPYAYEYVRLATQVGGIPGLFKKFTREVLAMRSGRTILRGLRGVARIDPVSLMKVYLDYEMSRIELSTKGKVDISSLMLHETMTDMALALDLDWMIKEYVTFVKKRKVTPGFNTGNFVYLVRKFEEWDIDLCETLIAAPFNKTGFQMIPSKKECEKTLKDIREPILIAISILAAGYLKPLEAADYIAKLPNLKGVAVGVSRKVHATETFSLLKEKIGKST